MQIFSLEGFREGVVVLVFFVTGRTACQRKNQNSQSFSESFRIENPHLALSAKCRFQVRKDSENDWLFWFFLMVSKQLATRKNQSSRSFSESFRIENLHCRDTAKQLFLIRKDFNQYWQFWNFYFHRLGSRCCWAVSCKNGVLCALLFTVCEPHAKQQKNVMNGRNGEGVVPVHFFLLCHELAKEAQRLQLLHGQNSYVNQNFTRQQPSVKSQVM